MSQGSSLNHWFTKSLLDIYASQVKNRELFTKTNFQDIGDKELGFSWETDPEKHRAVAKIVHPAFAARFLALQEPALHEHVDFFIVRMREYGTGENGVELNKWLDWLALDMSADLTYSRELNQVRDMKSSTLLNLLQTINFLGTIIQITKKFPLLTPLTVLFLPPSLIRSLPAILKFNRHMVKDRLAIQGKTKHPDFFQQLCPDKGPIGSENFLGAVIGQVMIAGYDPMVNLFYASIYYLLKEPSTLQILIQEIRQHFRAYEDINNNSLVTLSYLQAVVQESLRLYTSVSFGQPRRSPGAMVDGNFIPAGVVVQNGVYARNHSARYFREPRNFRPQRWLPKQDPNYESIFDSDEKSAFSAFSQGPRSCPGSNVTWLESRLFLAKLLWTFDIELVPGQTVDLERDLRMYAMWERPDLFVRFVPVVRKN